MFSIALEHPDQPDIVQLIADLDDYQKPLYPPESHHGIDMKALTQPNVIFAVARLGDGAAVGCGAVVLNDGYGELKRMFVRPSCRGQGIAKALITFLEARASEGGSMRMMLETGTLQPEALALYERMGYELRGPFGSYGPDPLSVFMQKPLAVNH